LTTISRIKPFLAAMLFACMAQAPVAHAALLSLQPDITHASTGDTISLDLVVSELGDFSPDSLGAFDVYVNYDASVLSFTDYTLGILLGDIITFTALDFSSSTAGEVNVAEVSLLSAASLDALQPGEFILASLRFDVLNLPPDAITTLHIQSDAVLSDATEEAEALQVTTGGPATIQTVPLPGTLWLMLSGLVGWSVTRRVRKPGI
jgi:hypothetical protein